MSIKYLTFNESNSPSVIKIANRLADLVGRKPHDAIKRIIAKAGAEEIVRLGGDISDLGIDPESIQLAEAG